MNINELEVYLKLSLQRALLGNVTSNIRGVVALLDDNQIYLTFYYDGEISESDEEIASEIETEVIADFDDKYTIDTQVKRFDSPQRIKLDKGFLVYLRKE